MDELLLSDRIRRSYINQGAKIDHEPSRAELIEADDWILVRSVPEGLQYNEFWGESCWQALYKKPGYRGLPRQQAIHKFMRERFPALTGEWKIYSYSFINGILRVTLQKPK